MRKTPALAAASAIFASALAFGGSPPDFVLRLPLPAPGQAAAAASLDAVLDPVYADANGNENEIAHSLDLYRLDASVTYGLSRSFALGAIGTWAENRYCCANGRALSDSGFTGAGLFLDWRPGASTSLLRFGYQSQKQPGSDVLPVSDGQDRVFVRSDWSLLPGLGRKARIGLRVDLDYGRPFEIQKAWFRALGELAPQFPVVRSERWSLDALATAGFLAASDARENGTIFHNRRSTSARAGAALHLGLGRDRRSQILLEGGRDFASRNALSGWRVGLTFRRLFGGR